VIEHDKPLRLFVAASLPRAELERIDLATKDVRDRLIGARWAPLENQHVTLKFLGATPADRLAAVERVVSEVAGAHAPSSLSLKGLGVFPSPRRARVLWAGIEDEAGLMTSLAEGLASSFASLGYEPEKRPFTPHLTLARFRDPAPVDRDLLVLEAGEPFVLHSVELYRSRLSPKGARYEVLRSVPLGG
jgi:RNA 2',3'-cyclic 3'-phosphodiesterase